LSGNLIEQFADGRSVTLYLLLNDGVDLRKLSPESRPYIDAIADTFHRPAVGVMATAETISHVGQWPLDYDNWDGPEDDGRAP
jgi:hypothetical protein